LLQFGVSRVDGHSPFETFRELNADAGKAEAVRLGRELKAASFPLHDVVVADGAFVEEAADALQVSEGRSLCGFGLVVRGTGEAAIVVGAEAGQGQDAAAHHPVPMPDQPQNFLADWSGPLAVEAGQIVPLVVQRALLDLTLGRVTPTNYLRAHVQVNSNACWHRASFMPDLRIAGPWRVYIPSPQEARTS